MDVNHYVILGFRQGSIFTVGDEGAVRSTCPLGGEKEEEENEERWKFGWQQ